MKFFTFERRLIIELGLLVALSSGLIAVSIEPSVLQDWLINLSVSAIVIVLTALVVERLIETERTRRLSPARETASKKLAGPLHGMKMELADLFGQEEPKAGENENSLSFHERAVIHDKRLLAMLLELDYSSGLPIKRKEIKPYIEQLERTLKVIEEDLKYYSYALSPEERSLLHNLYESISLNYRLAVAFKTPKNNEALASTLTALTPGLLNDIVTIENELQLDSYPK